MITKERISFDNGSGFNPKLLDCIVDYVSYTHVPIPEIRDDLAKVVTAILFGSKKTRLGRMPNPQEVSYMQEKVQRWVAVDKPIELVSLWGVLKGYGQIDDRQSVDIMDVMALRRFADLNRQIQGVYPPGLSVRIIREDVGEYALTGKTLDLPRLIGTYSRNLDRLCVALDISDHISFVDESRLLELRHVTPAQFLQQARDNARLFLEYWSVSNSVKEVQEWIRLPEYTKLSDMGWKGIIPMEMRAHYLGRVANEHPDASEEEKIVQVCTYLGTAFARYQFKLIQGSYRDIEGNLIPPIKASFVPYPPGTDESLKKGRVEYKVKDNKNSNNSTPPWAGFGFMCVCNPEPMYFEPRIIPLNEYRKNGNGQISPVSVCVYSTKGISQSFRADVIQN